MLLLGVSLFGGERLGDGDGARVYNDNIFRGLISAVSLGAFDLANDVHSLDDLSEHNVTPIQPGCLLCCDEEL